MVNKFDLKICKFSTSRIGLLLFSILYLSTQRHDQLLFCFFGFPPRPSAVANVTVTKSMVTG